MDNLYDFISEKSIIDIEQFEKTDGSYANSNKGKRYLVDFEPYSKQLVDDSNYIDLLAHSGKTYNIESPMDPIVSVKNNIMHLYFPTPYKWNKSNDDKKLIKKTQKLIRDTLRDKSIKEIVLDLRGNLGGNFSVFYDSLYSLLPLFENKTIVTGVNKENKTIAKISTNGKFLEIYINKIGNSDMEMVYQYKRTETFHTDLPVKLLINEMSMSSSQLIAIMFLSHKDYGPTTVSGIAPELYTNGSLSHLGFTNSNVVFPYYVFKDNNGIVYHDGVQ